MKYIDLHLEYFYSLARVSRRYLFAVRGSTTIFSYDQTSNCFTFSFFFYNTLLLFDWNKEFFLTKFLFHNYWYELLILENVEFKIFHSLLLNQSKNTNKLKFIKSSSDSDVMQYRRYGNITFNLVIQYTLHRNSSQEYPLALCSWYFILYQIELTFFDMILTQVHLRKPCYDFSNLNKIIVKIYSNMVRPNRWKRRAVCTMSKDRFITSLQLVITRYSKFETKNSNCLIYEQLFFIQIAILILTKPLYLACYQLSLWTLRTCFNFTISHSGTEITSITKIKNKFTSPT